MTGMKLYSLDREQRVDEPLEQVFAFCARPENLALITPQSLDFHLLTPSPIVMEQGRIIDYTIRVLGVRLRWRSLISTYRAPHCFVDEQLRGPYSFWHHTHRFIGEGPGTRLIDEVRYALPTFLPKPLAAAVHRWHVQPALKYIFDYRREQIARLFGPEASRAKPPVALVMRPRG